MIPGMGRIDPRQMRMAMKRMGMQTEELEDVVEVLIRTKDRELRFDKPAVVKIKVSGQTIFQITGEPEEGKPSSTDASRAQESSMSIQKEDIELVMGQTGCTEDEARQALIETEGQPADAIIRILGGKKS